VTAGLVDTNVLLRALLTQDPAQSARARALLETPDARYQVPDTALVEFVFVLGRHYGFTRHQVAQAVGALLLVPSLRLESSVVTAAVRRYVESPKLSFEDCLMAAQATAQGVPLYTFDRKLADQEPAARLV
jgi:predicted nucleic-acid-binding protein